MSHYNDEFGSNEVMLPSLADPYQTFLIPSTLEASIHSVFPFSILKHNPIKGAQDMEIIPLGVVNSTHPTPSNVTEQGDVDMRTPSRKIPYSSMEECNPSDSSHPQPRKMKKISPQPPPRKLSAQLEESLLPHGHHKNEGSAHVEGWHYKNVPSMHPAGFLLQDNVAYGYPGV